MKNTDQDFREDFKPLAIPSSYERSSTFEEQVVFTLAILGQASAEDVFRKMQDYEPTIGKSKSQEVENTLDNLYKKGLLKGSSVGNEREYNLSKITEPNKGYVDPDLLAPGLD